MRRFVKKAAILLSIFFIPIGCLELLIRLSENEYSYKYKYVMNNGEDIETLVLGTSRAYCSINPSILGDGAFVLANSGQSLKMDLEMLKQYDNELSNLKRVFLELSVFSFYSYQKTGENLDDPRKHTNYQVFMGLGGDFCSLTNNIIFFNEALFNESLSRIYNGVYLRCDELGQDLYYSYYYPPVNLDTKGVDQALTEWNNGNPDMVKINTEYINKIVSSCQDRSIRLVLFTAPVWHTLFENIDCARYDAVQTIIDDIVQLNNIEYYNYIDDHRFIDQDFVDGHHLSSVGATKFSTILTDTLKYVK